MVPGAASPNQRNALEPWIFLPSGTVKCQRGCQRPNPMGFCHGPHGGDKLRVASGTATSPRPNTALQPARRSTGVKPLRPTAVSRPAKWEARAAHDFRRPSDAGFAQYLAEADIHGRMRSLPNSDYNRWSLIGWMAYRYKTIIALAAIRDSQCLVDRGKASFFCVCPNPRDKAPQCSCPVR